MIKLGLHESSSKIDDEQQNTGYYAMYVCLGGRIVVVLLRFIVACLFNTTRIIDRSI